MRRSIFLTIALTLIAGTLSAATFDKACIAPQVGKEVLSRDAARDQLGCDLFSNPYATVTIANVDIYDVFPYVEARHFQVVSDPGWNRLIFGETGKSLHAFDGAGTRVGALAQPRGLAVDEHNRIYIADSGNDRVVILHAVTEFDQIRLEPVEVIEGFHRPCGVAYSDGGTPFQAGDDRLYVADTGKNRVVTVALEAAGPRTVTTLGELGSAVGSFASPMAIAVGRRNGKNTSDVYVADAHNHRIVHLRDTGDALAWTSATRQEPNLLTSLDTDHWGNVYAAAPHEGAVRKFNSDLSQIAELREDPARPRSFHVPFFNVHDHRAGSITRLGQPSGVMIEQWDATGGMKLWNLGVEVRDLTVIGGDEPAAHFILTDRADITLEVEDTATGRTLNSRPAGIFEAGVHALALLASDLNEASGELTLRLTARSIYGSGPTHVAQAGFSAIGGGVAAPGHALLLGSSPTPFMPSTRIAFVLPDGSTSDASLRVFDAMGRLVRSFDEGFSTGLNELLWDGRNDAGHGVAAGVYFYKLGVGEQDLTRQMVLIRGIEING